MRVLIKLIIALGILGIFNISLFMGCGIFDKNPFQVNEKLSNELNESTSWIFSGFNIVIDNNWSDVKDTYEWCTGEGTESHPYLIEHVIIDGQGSWNCIDIRNSNDYFIIQKCMLYDSSGGHYYGIKMNNVSNGNIIDNNFFGNYFGIYFKSSNNNTIFGNKIYENDVGVYLVNCNNNTISGNIADDNFYGISLSESKFNHLLGNTVNCIGGGIEIYESDNNVISRNVANNNFNGIFLIRSSNNTLSDNVGNYNKEDGLSFSDSDNNLIANNTVNHNGENGIVLQRSSNNTVLGNIAIMNDYNGIDLQKGNNNSISENLMYFCGINIDDKLQEMASHHIDDTNLINNKPIYYYVNAVGLNSSDFANAGQIILINCNDSTISGTDLSNGSIGIYSCYCNNITILENTIKNNNQGIFLRYCLENTISRNLIAHNDFGISISASFYNLVTENKILHNNIQGMYVESRSYYNTIFLNNFTNNQQNALDNGLYNNWDNGSIGNYWDDYTSVDANDDGIGDTPYSIKGWGTSYDKFPIWNDGPYQPTITFGNYFLLFMMISVASITILISKKLKFLLTKGN